MATTVYTASIEKEGHLYAALCPELDVASQGATVEEATSNLREAVEFVPRVCRSGRCQASASDRCLCNEDRSHAWVGFASGRDAKSVGSFSSTGSSRCAGAEVPSSCSAAPTPAVSRFHPRP